MTDPDPRRPPQPGAAQERGGSPPAQPRGGPLLAAPRLARSAALNLAGATLPALAGIIAIPLLIASLGTDRFGLLMLIWAGLGYLSVIDAGLGKALTHLLADRHGSEQTDDLGSLIWTGMFMLGVLGVLVGVAVAAVAQPLVEQVLQVQPALQSEAVSAFRLLALGVPVVLLTKGSVGILASQQRFAMINAVRVPSGILTFVALVAAVRVSPGLVTATITLLAARAVLLIAYLRVAATVQPELARVQRPRWHQVAPLLHFGSWLLLINVLQPLMVYMDRFVVGSMLGMTWLTYYATPFAVMQRLATLPQAISVVLFPAMTATIAAERTRLPRLHGEASRMLLLLMLPPTVGLFLLAPEALRLWLGEPFSVAGAPVVRWLAAGWLVSSVVRPTHTVLLSSGRPDLVAKLRALQIPPYALALWWLTRSFGIAGTAGAWFALILVDALVTTLLARAQLADLRSSLTRVQLAIGVASIGFLVLSRVQPLSIRVLIVALVAVVCGALSWPSIRKMLPQVARGAAASR